VTPRKTRPRRAAVFAKVKMFCTRAPSLTPYTFRTDRMMIVTMPARFWVFRPTSMLPSTIGPMRIGGTCAMCQIQCVEEIDGKKMPRNLPKATPTAAMVPV
jgi:hypothetical protein